MKPFLKPTQRYALIIGLIILVSVAVGVSSGGDLNKIDQRFGLIVSAMAAIPFGTVPGLLAGIWSFLNQIPLVVLVLISGAIFFTFRFDFVNLRGVSHAIKVVAGKYDDPNNPGEVTHFQALSTALSATVGLGNIAGVAIAVGIGGPGAVFWMMAAAIFGMTSKFAECTLGQMYRKVDANGAVQGGPMVYLRDGLAEIGRPVLGRYLSVIFAVLCIGGSFGGGNMFQANQSFAAMANLVPWFGGERARGEVTLVSEAPMEMAYARHLARFSAPSPLETEDVLYFNPAERLEIGTEDWTRGEDGRWTLTLDVVAADSGHRFDVAAGTISTLELARVEGRQVNWNVPVGVAALNEAPVEGGVQPRSWLYGIVIALLVGMVIIGGIQSIGKVASKIVPAMCVIYVAAALYILLSNVTMIPHAVGIIIGEAFAPKAGLGGLVGVLIVGIQRAAFSNEAGVGSAAIAHSAARTKEPVREGFVALLEPAIDTLVVCFMTGIVVVITGVYADPATAGLEGVALTSAAFETVISWFPYILSIAVILFAFSTMISWSYYGERCWSFLFGANSSMIYRVIFLFFVFLGSVSSLSNVLDFSDLMILSMAFPNILGAVLLSGKIRAALISYWDRLEAGEFDV
ncbi:alanine/glycine:cation symporter family protein [Lujinxingia vulgaris]|uniref:alanine/glycine:cation symporter family protein n=1 Tax=Lujinxingia vulgaris TaxID=2600176 RepID=UPI001E567190|nr:alanine/glycine:cation symporter family protein [Lujinxingia vulgaris]